MPTAVRTRFAPSPTGYLHVGGARTALFNWLFARHHQGTFILRVEDTDRARNTPEALEAIYGGLRWLGLEWDEGPEAGGNHGPYFQSERDAIYERFLDKLHSAGRVYEDAGAIRFRFDRRVLAMEDLVCGPLRVDMSDPSTQPDMTIRRPDGGWIFHFVNVVDDIEMGITHVIRGEDHLSNTPKHIQLYEALGAPLPAFAHIPLILNPDGTKMSKRDTGASVQSYVDAGFLPEALRNYLCLLGWSPKDNSEKLPIDDVISRFGLSAVNRKGAQFDMDKLLWLTGEYVRELPPERFMELARRSLTAAGYDLGRFDEAYVESAITTCFGKVHIFSELAEYAGFYFTESVTPSQEDADKIYTPDSLALLRQLRDAFAACETWDATSLEAALKNTGTQLGIKPRALVQPLRLSCTGKTAGPSLYHLMEVLGKTHTIQRIGSALASA